MTAIIGMLCNDGVVIGADSSSTFSSGRQRTIEQPCEKINIIEDKIIVAGTGQVGLGQRFTEVVRKAWVDKKFRNTMATEVGKYLCAEGIKDFALTQATKEQYGSLVAFPLSSTPYLCEFAITDFQPEFKTPEKIWFCSIGSGQSITDPFLAFMRSVFWCDGSRPNVREGIFSTIWALEHVIDCNPGGVNGPVSLAVLEKKSGDLKARRIPENELNEARQYIDEAKAYLREFPKRLNRADDVPAIPQPNPP